MTEPVLSQLPDSAAKLLDGRQVAEMLGCSARHVYRLNDAGDMPRCPLHVLLNAAKAIAKDSDGKPGEATRHAPSFSKRRAGLTNRRKRKGANRDEHESQILTAFRAAATAAFRQAGC